MAYHPSRINVIWIYPEHDLVVAVRWIDKPNLPGFFEHVAGSVAA